jgi:multiple sugar transport system ATP-binding protein
MSVTNAGGTAARTSSSNGAGGGIRFIDVDKHFETFYAVRKLNLGINDGELLVLLGPSGCGKTTTLNMLAGLEQPSGGQLRFGDQVMNDVPPEERDIAMVFQSIALYPHLNVRENIGFALATQRTSKDVIRQRVAEVSKTLDIDRFLDRKIHQLSGGQRQRVAIAKALVRRPRLFLLDEPFSSLDAELRRQMRGEIVRIHRSVETTMVFVTHDQEEAMAIADRIAVMNAGELVQLGPPLDLYLAPRNLWIARFIGSHPINVLESTIDLESGQAFLMPNSHWGVALPVQVRASLRGKLTTPEVYLGIRPEHLVIAPGAPAEGEVAGEVFTRQILGTEVLYEVKTGDGLLQAVTPSSKLYEIGAPVKIAVDWTNILFFDRKSEDTILAAP